MVDDWAIELSGLDLGDGRLNKRAVQLMERLSADPTLSVNAACQGWSETQAAYRFFANPRIAPDRLLAPHREATLRRAASQPVVLWVQDTSELDYSRHPAPDVGVLDRPERRGLYAHVQAAFTPEGLCLGVLEATFLERSGESLGQARKRKQGPLAHRESVRWLTGYQRACQAVSATSSAQIVSVADCEADMYDVFLEAERHPTPADFIIRAKIDRRLPRQDPSGGAHAYLQAWEVVAGGEPLAVRTLPLSQTPKRRPRIARLEVRAQRLTLKPPQVRGRDPQVTLNLVLVTEIDPPNDGTAVQWKLLTTLPIDSADAVWRIADYYAARWGIEVFFRVLKTGCRVEEIQLETVARLRNCLALYLIIAWRIMAATHLGRTDPAASCTTLFADAEWKSTWQIVTGRRPPETPPTLADFLPVLATLGGYNGRRRDSPPGPQTLWIALRRMNDYADAWTASRKTINDVCK